MKTTQSRPHPDLGGVNCPTCVIDPECPICPVPICPVLFSRVRGGCSVECFDGRGSRAQFSGSFWKATAPNSVQKGQNFLQSGRCATAHRNFQTVGQFTPPKPELLRMAIFMQRFVGGLGVKPVCFGTGGGKSVAEVQDGNSGCSILMLYTFPTICMLPWITVLGQKKAS